MSLETIFYNLVFVGAFAFGVYLLISLKSSENWVPTIGVLERLEASQLVNSQSSTRSDNIDYPVDIVYSFKANGKTYRGSNIYAGVPPVFDDLNDLEEFLKKYELLKEVELFYDPNKPENSALMRPGMTSSQYAFLWVFFIIVASILFAVINVIPGKIGR